MTFEFDRQPTVKPHTKTFKLLVEYTASIDLANFNLEDFDTNERFAPMTSLETLTEDDWGMLIDDDGDWFYDFADGVRLVSLDVY